MSIELEDVPSGYNLSKINNNFQTIENYVNTSLLHRAETSVAGEAKMGRDLDMDSHNILNGYVGDIPLSEIAEQTNNATIALENGGFGYVILDSFQDGNTIEFLNQALRWKLPDGDGEFYRWDGDFPKVVPVGSTPATTGGIGEGAWLSVGDTTLRTDLKKDNGASLINYKKPYTDAITRNVSSYFNQEINVDDFGAVGNALLPDGTANPDRTDDSAAFQKAILAAWRAGGVKVVATPWKSYYIANKVYTLATEGIPLEANSHPTRRIQIIDLQGATIIGRDDNTTDTNNILFESGFLDTDGIIKTVFGTGDEQYLTAGTIIQNFSPKNFYTLLKLKGHVFGCSINNIMATDIPQILYTERCFYTELRNIHPSGTSVIGLHRYHLKDNNNIMPINSVHTGVCDMGFRFEGATEAITMVNCGIEGFTTHGVWISGGYNLKFDSCYFESGAGSTGCIATSTPRITVENCWIFGGVKMFGGFNDNTNVSINNNNIIGGGSIWWNYIEGSEYNLSDIHWPTEIVSANVKVPTADAKFSSTVNQTKVAYNPSIGLTAVVGKYEQCSGLHSTRVNGRTGLGSSSCLTPGCVVTQEVVSGTTRRAKWETGIVFTDTQLVRVALSVNHDLGTWKWRGFIDGDVIHRIAGVSGEDITIANEGGFLVIRTVNLLSTNLGILGGEIRLV